MSELLTIFSSISSILGPGAAIAVIYAIFTVRNLEKRVGILENENALLKRDISDIKADTSYIRGVLEGTKPHG